MASALLSVLIYAVLAALSDARQVSSALTRFPLPTLGAMVALTLTCYGLRAVRWWYLARLAGHPMGALDAVFVQLGGMTMTVTPGKIGEVLKAALGRRISGLPMASGVALVFSERLTDLIAVLALSAGAVGIVSNTGPALIASAVALAAAVSVLASHRVHERLLSVASRQPWLKRHHEAAAGFSAMLRTTLAPKPLIVSTGIAVLAWGSEGIAFALCLRALGFEGLGWPAAVAVYAIATVVGALTFLPGGIGLTEASIAGLLVAAGMPGPDASVATLLIRLVTLWFGVALGWLTLATRPQMLRTLTEPESEDFAETD